MEVMVVVVVNGSKPCLACKVNAQEYQQVVLCPSAGSQGFIIVWATRKPVPSFEDHRRKGVWEPQIEGPLREKGTY